MFVTFGLLARKWPCNPAQPTFRRPSLADDALYCLVAVSCYGGAGSRSTYTQARACSASAAGRIAERILAGYGVAASLPLLAQALLIIVCGGLRAVLGPRLFHEPRALAVPCHPPQPGRPGLDRHVAITRYNYLIYSSGVSP